MGSIWAVMSKPGAPSAPLLEAHAEVIEAGLAIVSRDTEAAIERWARAEAIFAEYGMEAHCASIRVQVARVSSGESAHETPEYFERAKIREPERVAKMSKTPIALRWPSTSSSVFHVRMKGPELSSTIHSIAV